MRFETFYNKEFRKWGARMVDNAGRMVGAAQYGASKEHAAYLLGVEYGRNPSKFAQPLSEILEAHE